MASIHVIPHKGGWAVQKDGEARSDLVYEHKEEAMVVGREQAEQEGVELVVHDSDGRILYRVPAQGGQ